MGWFNMVVCMGHHTNYSLAKTFGTVGTLSGRVISIIHSESFS